MEGEGMSWMLRKVSVLCPLKWDIGEDERLGKMGPLA